MERSQIQDIVLRAIERINLSRRPDDQLDVRPDGSIFGPDSRLDSLGLVTLLIDVEEALQDAGLDVTLNDARAMSATRSPFRNVPSLVDFIMGVMAKAQ